MSCLDVTDSAGNIKSITVGSQSNESLLLELGGNEGVDLEGLDIVKFLDGLLDLVLVGSSVDLEDKGVGVLNLLDGTFRVDVGDDDLVGVESWEVGNRLAEVLRVLWELQSLWSSEGSRGSNGEDLVAVDTLGDGLLSLLGLLGSGD